MGGLDYFEELGHLGLWKGSESFCDLADEVFYVVLLKTAFDHC